MIFSLISCAVQLSDASEQLLGAESVEAPAAGSPPVACTVSVQAKQ
jgi:hypothetical protein